MVQMKYYKEALEKVTESRVKEVYLYLFALMRTNPALIQERNSESDYITEILTELHLRKNQNPMV